MKSKIIYANIGGNEAHEPTTRDCELLSRRQFIRRSSLFLPLAWLAGSVGFLAGSTERAKGASTIISRTISSANQNAISMANSTWARPVALPASWNKIRIGCRLHMTNTGADLLSNPIFTMGFLSGTGSQYGDATTSHFLGTAFDATSYVYVVGVPAYRITMMVGRKRVGTTNTNVSLAAGANTYINAGAAAASADRQIVFLDVTKGSPNYTLQMPTYIDASVGAGADVSAANFLAFMAQSAPVPGGNYQGAGTASTIAVNEGTDGTFNAINCYWNRTDATLEICDVAVAVLS